MSTPRNFSRPALSLSLAGVYNSSVTVEEEDERDGESGGAFRYESVDGSSENTGTGRSANEEADPLDEGDINMPDSKKKRKKYHRHSVEQIKEMEALFKEWPHPDEKQRKELGDRLGLAPRQVKFWFQNRRTQIKTIQERHENSLIKSEMEKLREENRSLREKINNCRSCGPLSSSEDRSRLSDNEQLLIENAELRAEIANLRRENHKSSSLAHYRGLRGVDRSKILETADRAMEELRRMASAKEPLWFRSLESGREILNYDEYQKEFSPETILRHDRRLIEASRETGDVILDVAHLVQSFMDVNQWMEMFPNMIAKAAVLDIISKGGGERGNGVVQLMSAELQMLSPTVPARQVYFVRYCRQQNPNTWAIVDVSLSSMEDGQESQIRCRRLPSGCIIREKSNGRCTVTWVEHSQCQRGAIHSVYRPAVNSGVAFGAWRWLATLQQQCERIVFSLATNVPTKDSFGVSTLAGRKSTLRLAHRMASSFCKAVGASGSNSWIKMSTTNGDEVRISSRKNSCDQREPLGTILAAVSSFWLPVPASVLFDFLRDDAGRSQWDVLLSGRIIRTVASIAKGQHRGNSATLLVRALLFFSLQQFLGIWRRRFQAAKSGDGGETWLLQDSSTNSFESMVVYAPIEVAEMQSAMSGCDPRSVEVLPSGISIWPDNLNERSPLTSLSPARASETCGSLVTVAFQLLIDASLEAKVSMESVEAACSLVSSTISNIKKVMRCEDR